MVKNKSNSLSKKQCSSSETESDGDGTVLTAGATHPALSNSELVKDKDIVKTVKTVGVTLDPINIKNGIPKFRLALTSFNYSLLIVKSMYIMMYSKERTKSPGSDRSPSVSKTRKEQDSKDTS